MSQGDVLVNRRMQSSKLLSASSVKSQHSAAMEKLHQDVNAALFPRTGTRQPYTATSSSVTNSAVSHNPSAATTTASVSTAVSREVQLLQEQLQRAHRKLDESAEELSIVREQLKRNVAHRGTAIQEANEALLHEVLCLLEAYGYGDACEIVIRNEESLLRAASTIREHSVPPILAGSSSSSQQQYRDGSSWQAQASAPSSRSQSGYDPPSDDSYAEERLSHTQRPRGGAPAQESRDHPLPRSNTNNHHKPSGGGAATPTTAAASASPANLDRSGLVFLSTPQRPSKPSQLHSPPMGVIGSQEETPPLDASPFSSSPPQQAQAKEQQADPWRAVDPQWSRRQEQERLEEERLQNTFLHSVRRKYLGLV